VGTFDHSGNWVFGVNTSSNVSLNGPMNKYNGVSTAGWGIPSIYASGRFTAQTAAKAVVATNTVGASDGSFLVSGNLNFTTATTFSITLQCSYTDEGNTARNVSFTVVKLDGTRLTTVANTDGAGPYSGTAMQIRAKAGTAITILTAGTFTTVTYNVEGTIQQIS